MVTPLRGTVVERDGATYRVRTGEGELRAVLRGKSKRDTPRVVVGDLVDLEPETGGSLYGITGVAPRRTLLERRVPEGRGARPAVASAADAAAAPPTSTRSSSSRPHAIPPRSPSSSTACSS